MAPRPLSEGRLTRRLQRRRQHGEHVPSVELPENLRETDDAADEDITISRAPSNMAPNMNQSLFGLMMAAGSTADFDNGHASGSSDDEGDAQAYQAPTSQRDIAHTVMLPPKPSSGRLHGQHRPTPLPTAPADTKLHRRRISRSMLKSLSALSPLSPRRRERSKLADASSEQSPSSSQPETDAEPEPATAEMATCQKVPKDSTSSGATSSSPAIEVSYGEGRVAPILSRMLDAQEEMASRPSFDIERLSEDQSRQGESDNDDDLRPSRLSRKLKEIFKFEEHEDVIAEYPAWFLQSVLLQGYMYVTQKHICFYSYLPKKGSETVKTGFLSKTGKRNPKYNRYWFRLKGDVLQYYRDASNPYFPHGHIDLRYAISANISDKDKEGINFTIETANRTYYFKADSPQSAKEWVKSLQRVIFRSHNDGDSVKISLPIHNVIDVEKCPMLEYSGAPETCKLRVIDNDETYAMDEYFFSFSESSAGEAFHLLRILVEGSSAHNTDSEKPAGRTTVKEMPDEPSKAEVEARLKIRESVKATLAATSTAASSPRGSGEFTRASMDGSRPFRRSFDDRGRRSLSETRRLEQKEKAVNMEKSKSSDSYVQSMEDRSISAIVASSSEEASASQILRGSDVFHSPTLPRRSGSGSRGAAPEGNKQSSTPNDPTYRAAHSGMQQQPLTPTMAKRAVYPIQMASRWATTLTNSTGRMGNLLATESMGYVEKVSGMWKGGHKHYNEPHGLKPDIDMDNDDDPAQIEVSNERFREHFALPETENLVATYFASLFRVLPLYGKIYISNNSFCFRSLLPGTRTKLILPIKDIETADKERGFRMGYSGLCLIIKGHEELFFEFNRSDIRDDCVVTMLQSIEKTRYLGELGMVGEDEQMATVAMAERDALHEASQGTFPSRQLPRYESSLSEPTILFDDPKASFLIFKPKESLNITCLTIGSRGDVQPYIAFCKGLMAEGHKAKIATHAEFQPWIEGHGIEFGKIEGDPGELMRICIDNGTFTLAFLREANSKFRGWLDDLLLSAWEACQGSDLLVESPSAMAGIHIAEALSIPYFRAFTMPWTRTRAYPHAFIVPENRLGGSYNYLTYVMFDNLFWKAQAGQINRWRNNTLNLPNTNLEKMAPNKVPFLYNFSSHVVPPPLDYSDWIRVTGYWFLDERDQYTPPEDLKNFIAQARKDGKKLVYVGFGSIIVADSVKMTQEVIDAVTKADVRCILSKGWSDRAPVGGDDNKAATKDDLVIPPEIFQIKSVPHDWLFSQIDAAAHHGGSGTTGASLRAGIPTVIRPFFGDQFFFGSRVEDLGVGIQLTKWGAFSFAKALWEATHSQRMIDKAKVLGENIRNEDGVQMAIRSMYRDLEYSRSLVLAKTGRNSQQDEEDEEEEEEESWTFVGPEGNEETTVDLNASVILGKATAEPSFGSVAEASKVS